MSGPNNSMMEDDANRWLVYAQDDLKTAQLLLERSEIAPWVSCFHAQQAAEKALKSLLVRHQRAFPKTHDLLTLKRLLPAGTNLNVTDSDLALLGAWAVEARYPGALPDATNLDARRACDAARAIVDAALRDDESFD